MKEYLPYITLAIALYGAVLSSVTSLRSRRRLRLSFEMGFLCFHDKTMTTFGALEVTNCSSVPVYIKEYGFEAGKNKLQVSKIPKKVHESLDDATICVDTNSRVDINLTQNALVDEVSLLEGGQSASQYFYAKDLKRVFLGQPKIKIFGYCIDQTGKKFRCKVSKDLILSSKEPV